MVLAFDRMAWMANQLESPVSWSEPSNVQLTAEKVPVQKIIRLLGG